MALAAAATFLVVHVELGALCAGDHLYRMNYGTFVAAHRATGADITVAALPCDEKRASSFGVMKIDGEGRIVEFAEKPKARRPRALCPFLSSPLLSCLQSLLPFIPPPAQGDALKAMRVDTTVLGLDKKRAEEMPYIASMGIYVAKASAMRDLLLKHYPDAMDFGGEIIPGAESMGMHVQAHLFDGYWEDIGTIESFYNANLGLCGHDPNFSFYDRDAPIYTQSRFLPPSKVLQATVDESIIGDGCLIKNGATVKHSVIGLRSCVGENAVIEDALVMGCDFYETPSETRKGAKVPLGVGDRSVVRRAILDKNARIGRDVQLINKEGVTEANRESEVGCPASCRHCAARAPRACLGVPHARVARREYVPFDRARHPGGAEGRATRVMVALLVCCTPCPVAVLACNLRALTGSPAIAAGHHHQGRHHCRRQGHRHS